MWDTIQEWLATAIVVGLVVGFIVLISRSGSNGPDPDLPGPPPCDH